jgi:putative N6-adenine-specific DNA methylase
MERVPEYQKSEGKTAELRIHIEKDVVSVMLDICGEPLFKRGYRVAGGPAPLRETTAAAILLYSGWRRKTPLYDPFCGAGTIILEAAIFAWNMAPGIGRTFMLSNFKIANDDIEKRVRLRLRDKIDMKRRIRITGSDADADAVKNAKTNIAALLSIAKGENMAADGSIIAPSDPKGPVRKTITIKIAAKKKPEVHETIKKLSIHKKPKIIVNGATDDCISEIHVRQLNMEYAAAEDDEQGVVITNPPYGRRLGTPAEAESVYREMGGLRRRFPEWNFSCITDHPGFEAHFGKNADYCRKITNGAIQAYLYIYNNEADNEKWKAKRAKHETDN